MGIGGNGCLHGNCESYHFDRSLVIGQVKSDSFGVVIAKLSNKYGMLRRNVHLVRTIGSILWLVKVGEREANKPRLS